MKYQKLKWNLIFLAIGILFFYLAMATSVSAANAGGNEQEEILVIGTGYISGGNVASARKNAISDALVKGVEEFLTRRLGSDGMINNFSRIIHDIIPAAEEGTENFNILAEDQTSKHYKILVRIKMNEEMMEERFKEMGYILVKGSSIKVLFMVSQEDTWKKQTSYWWRDPDDYIDLTSAELILHRVFQERGFSPINRAFNFPDESYSDEMTKLDLSVKDLLRWGNLFSSDIVIHGNCEIVQRDMVSITLKSYDVESGSMITMGHQVAEIVDDPGISDNVMRSIENVVNRIAVNMIPETIKAIDVGKSDVNEVEIQLTGLKSFEQFRRFKNFLTRYVEGVNSVIQTKIRPNSMTLQVEYTGKREKFIDSMLNNDNFPYLVDVSTKEDGGLIVNII
ncbi:hypothetical protein ACFL1Z_01880 [Thermodesulfobacteriota bacterium]